MNKSNQAVSETEVAGYGIKRWSLPEKYLGLLSSFSPSIPMPSIRPWTRLHCLVRVGYVAQKIDAECDLTYRAAVLHLYLMVLII